MAQTDIPQKSAEPPSVVVPTEDFYEDLVPFRTFADITDRGRYRALPADWIVGVADVVHSTQAIEEGRYKAVNTVGAAVIAAITNAVGGLRFPFVFSGDGASFALPARHEQAAREGLAKTAAWSEDILQLRLRIAIIPVAEIRRAGLDVRVARFAASPSVSYAMFAGGGLTWADARLKEGRFVIERAAAGAMPDLSGLSCNFAPIKAERGVILSIIAVPPDDGPRFATLVADILALLDTEGCAGRPYPEAGPLPAWTGGEFEASIETGQARPSLITRAMIVQRAIVRRLLFVIGLPMGGFDPARYQRQLVDNTDFRKFDDGLRMTVDCSTTTADDIEARLALAEQAGVCRYGTHRQKAANLTCIVPSRIGAGHVHFVDGALGGYSAAAAKLKTKSIAKMPSEGGVTMDQQ